MELWEKLAVNAGLPGVMLVAFLYAIKLGIAAWKDIAIERVKVDDRRVTVEERKADAHVAALGALANKIEEHRYADLASHQEMTTELASLHTKIDTLAELTPVRGVPRVDQPGKYGPTFPRPKTSPGGR